MGVLEAAPGYNLSRLKARAGNFLMPGKEPLKYGISQRVRIRYPVGAMMIDLIRMPGHAM